MAVSLATSDLANLLAVSPHPLREDAVATDYFRTLQHFYAVTGPTFGNDMLSHIMQCVITDDAWDRPLLMQMTLAFSSAHKRHLLSQSDQREIEINDPTMEEARHWQQGLQLYQAEVSNIVNSSAPAKPYSDSLIAATFLTVMYAFTVDDDQQIQSVATSDELDITNTFAPIAATVGFQALRSRLGGLQGNSVWLTAVRTTRNNYESGEQGMLPRAFVELCGLNDSSSLETNPYREIIRHLTVLLRSSGTPESLSNLFGFSSRLWVSLDPLLQRRDARALLIMSWWFALLCQIKQWWTATRSRKACTLIVRYLSSSPDPLMQRLLEFPKTFGEADYSWIWD